MVLLVVQIPGPIHKAVLMPGRERASEHVRFPISCSLWNEFTNVRHLLVHSLLNQIVVDALHGIFVHLGHVL